MLKEIAIITIAVAELNAVETAWVDQLGYEVADRGPVSQELSEHWQAPAMEGKATVTLQPASGAEVFVRLVEDPPADNYAPMLSWGWNATEILVQNPDKIAADMASSAFDVVGAPKDLWDAPNAPRAMQAVGPGQELLYLTTNQAAVDALGIGTSMAPIDRVFIMVLGGPSMQDFQEFYGGVMGLTVDEPMQFPITMISKAHGLDISTTYPLAIVRLDPGIMIELDEYPATAEKRAVLQGHIPAGVAVVSFTADNLTASVLQWYTTPAVMHGFPYNGRETGLLVGPAGEWLEIIETSE